MTETAEQSKKALQLFFVAQGVAHNTLAFFEKKGAGAGDLANADFMKKLRKEAEVLFGADYSEKKACKGARYAFDFYFSDEATAVEIALSLHNPVPPQLEMEKAFVR